MNQYLWKYQKPGIVWALFILILCTVNTPDIYIPTVWDLFTFDKVVHFFFYSVFVVLIFRGLQQMGEYRLKFYLAGFLFCVVYGGLIEILQATCFPNRSGDWPDFIANTIGCIIGATGFSILHRRKNRA